MLQVFPIVAVVGMFLVYLGSSLLSLLMSDTPTYLAPVMGVLIVNGKNYFLWCKIFLFLLDLSVEFITVKVMDIHSLKQQLWEGFVF